MTRPTAFATPIVALALCSLLWLSSLAPALAATVTETFQLKLTGTERCRDNPNFVEPFTVKFKEGATLALTRDDTGVLTDVQATIGNSGNATLDAIALTGRAFDKNTSGRKAELALSGRDPGNPDRFLTLRGTATFNQAGTTLTSVTGTFIFQILDDLNGAPNIDCFGSGTFVARKPPSSGGGGRGGTLTVADAPASVGGKFVANPQATSVSISGNDGVGVWLEGDFSGGVPSYYEGVVIFFDLTTAVSAVSFQAYNEEVLTNHWFCGSAINTSCQGTVTVDRSAGTAVFSGVVAPPVPGFTAPPITLNGTLHFPPF
jgi:hypothetical protein